MSAIRTLAVAIAIAGTAMTVSAATTAAPSTTVTTVILVRHAEKDTTQVGDVPLSEAGTRRARELARVLGACRTHLAFGLQLHDAVVKGVGTGLKPARRAAVAIVLRKPRRGGAARRKCAQQQQDGAGAK